MAVIPPGRPNVPELLSREGGNLYLYVKFPVLKAIGD